MSIMVFNWLFQIYSDFFVRKLTFYNYFLPYFQKFHIKTLLLLFLNLKIYIKCRFQLPQLRYRDSLFGFSVIICLVITCISITQVKSNLQSLCFEKPNKKIEILIMVLFIININCTSLNMFNDFHYKKADFNNAGIFRYYS